MFISATELHIRSFRHLFQFMKLSFSSMKQAKKSAGCLQAKMKLKKLRIGYTITVWDNKESMLQFRNSGAHKTAMQKIRIISHQNKVLHWEDDKIPNWAEAKARLNTIALKITN